MIRHRSLYDRLCSGIKGRRKSVDTGQIRKSFLEGVLSWRMGSIYIWVLEVMEMVEKENSNLEKYMKQGIMYLWDWIWLKSMYWQNWTQNWFFWVPPNSLHSQTQQYTVAEISVLWSKVPVETKDEESSYLELILENDSFNSVWFCFFSLKWLATWLE